MIYFATSKFPSFVACSGAFGYSPDAACNACTAGAERLVAGSSSGCKSPSTGQVLANLGSGTGCPYGYTMQSGSCTITNPADVKKPAGTTTLVRPVVPSAPTDSANPVVKPDAQSSDPLPENVNYGPDYIEISNPDGSTERIDFVPYQGTTGTNAAGKPHGSVDKITRTTPALDGSFTNVTTTDLKVDSSGAAVVQGQSSQDYTGTGSGQGTNPNPDMNCPGCARESTHQKVLGKLGEIKTGQDSTNGTLAQLKDNLDGVGVGAGNTPADMQSAANQGLSNVQAYTQGTGANSLTGQVNSILSSQIPAVNTSWVPSLLPGSVVACVPIPLTASLSHGVLAGITGTGYLDICDKLDLARQILGYLFGLATVIYIYFRFFRIL